ncbi:transglutaminase domain-containing protein [Streptomyces antimycoticus]|uniref:transglutaminase domain-containing protein n=1 Tax=Streptomyces antimycoticus TaxID=68175 RepID=UPI0036737E35
MNAQKEAVERVLMVPEWCRTYSASREDALTVYGMDDELIETLLDLGLPRQGRGRHLTFDPLDLENIGLALRLRSASRSAMLLWARSFKDPHRLAKATCTIQLSWSCPAPGHDGDCAFTASPTLRNQVDTATGRTSFEVELANDACIFGDPFPLLVAEAQRLHFHRIIPELAADLGFLHETRLADCRSANTYLASVAIRNGLAARQASGYFVGSPFLVAHVWLEVDFNDRWVAADPFFLMTLGHWGVVDPDGWPPFRSPRNVLWRLRGDQLQENLIMHDGQAVPVTLLARMSH